ncbi:LysR family transcriptional regulator [Sulfitobacter sp.]|jgi:DNA-binding transcriptional LysR family regulator|uniref:LysR family transcriptional regulator n=1 Tax=Sulfitobacter sp. TaxID=1903071 RepID=UPI0030030E09
MINIRQFRHFIAVLESGSLLGASKELNISQPALSKSIASIESYYKVPLFKRLPRGVQPTGFALTLEPHARRILFNVAESRTEIATIAAGSSGRIAVGTGSSFVGVLSEMMHDFDRDFPDVQFTVLTDHAHNLRQALLGNRIDFYVGMANNEFDDAAFDVQTLFADRFTGLCSPDHPFEGTELGPAQLAKYEWIFPNLEEPARAALDAYFISNKQVPPRVKITTNAEHVMRHFLSDTQFLSVTPFTNIHLPEFQGFGRFHLKGFEFERKVGIVRRTSAMSSPLVEKFIARLSDRVSQMRDGAKT